MKTAFINSYEINKTKTDLARINQVSRIDSIYKNIPEILFITSFPPRVCGIATYSQDLISALEAKFDHSFNISICPIETESEIHIYSKNIKNTLNIDSNESYANLTQIINHKNQIELVVIQHEFGLFKNRESELVDFLKTLIKPVIIVFHTVLPNPDTRIKDQIMKMVFLASSVIVMTQNSANLLVKEYEINPRKVKIIPHGTHLVEHADKRVLKQKRHFSNRKVLSTFGLMSSGKSIETSLDALPVIISKNPDVLFLIIGKTHPNVFKNEGEQYREMLYRKVVNLNLQNHVKFINQFLPLPELLEFLQLTDIYLFTSKDPNQAVSGTFAYALSCGCPIVSTPIPHAKELLNNKTGISIDFENSAQLAQAVNDMLENDTFRTQCSLNALHTMAQTAWENSAISHAGLFGKTSLHEIVLEYKLPPVNLKHIQKMSTDFGIIQFSRINHPDIESGYTLDDNARALVAYCQHFQLSNDINDLAYIQLYFDFIKYCLQPNHKFLNYVNKEKEFTGQNSETNLDDAQGRAIWALGFLLSLESVLPRNLILEGKNIFLKALTNVENIYSTRSISFIIKGIYYFNKNHTSKKVQKLIVKLSDRLVQMYKHEADADWRWFESYLTYGNSIMPEALLCAFQATGNAVYKDIAKESFDFLLSKIFHNNTLRIISNTSWLRKGQIIDLESVGGEQPIDVAYTIMALAKFREIFPNEKYDAKMKIAFAWFLGKNHLNQIIYNPGTGGCYDGLEKNYVNLNQGAESTVSYLLARLTMEKASAKPDIYGFTDFLNYEFQRIVRLNGSIV